MAKYVIDETTLKSLGEAIRGINGESASYTPEEMVEKIKTLSAAGPETPATISFKIAGTTYTAEEGMTWGQWIVSDYCPNEPGYCECPGDMYDNFRINHGYCEKFIACGCHDWRYAYIAPVNSVIKPNVELEIFDLGGCFEKGMTWEEYCASDYNPIVFCTHSENAYNEYTEFDACDDRIYRYVCSLCQGEPYYVTLDGEPVLPTDVVITGGGYSWRDPLEDEDEDE